MRDENRDGRINNHDLDARVRREALEEYRTIRDRLRNPRSAQELQRDLRRYEEFLNTPEMRRQRAENWRSHNEAMARLGGGLYGMASTINKPLATAIGATAIGASVQEIWNLITTGGTNPDHRVGD